MSLYLNFRKRAPIFFRFSFLLILIFFALPSVHAELSGPPIVDNNYNLDLRQGPVLGSARQVALGGAYIGVAEGIVSLKSNPAGVAFRRARSTGYFDWDWTLGATDLKSNDFDNNGSSPPDYVSRKFLNAGIMAQWGPWGAGLTNVGEQIDLENSPTGDSIVLNSFSFVLGRQMLEKELTVGAGIRSTFGKVRSKPLEASLGKLSSVGWETGILWNPQKGPCRLGLSFASKMNSDQSLAGGSTTPVTVQGLIIPQQIILPAEWGLGGSYQVKSAPFWKRHAWLISGDIILTEASENAVGVESMLAQKTQSVGTHNEIGYRIGSELETWPDRLRCRLGSYYEPSFYEGVSGRTHWTGGLEARLFHVKFGKGYDMGFSYTVDSSVNYLNQLISIGFWHSS